MLTIIAIVQAKEGREKELEQLLLTLVERTRKETGCIRYDLHRHLDRQGKFIFYESWTDSAALEQHRKTPHIAEFRTKAADLLAGPLQVDLCEMISDPIG